MAKSVAKRIKKLKKSKEYRVITIVIVFLIAAISYFFYQNNQNPIIYSSSQNEDGYYYYVETTDLNDYYYHADQLMGMQLENKLSDLINNNFQPVTYNDVRTYLEQSDLSIDDPTKIYNIYDGSLVDSVWDGGATWNREHVWPQSRLGLEEGVNGSDRNIATDLHNLRAASPSVNSSRSNRFYSAGSGQAGITDDSGYYPGDDHIGDVARILLYMVVMYDNLTLTDDLNELIDESDNYSADGAEMGLLSVLLEWHKLDPVDDFERQRNEVIYTAQGNRNPFIDHPEYVHLIWENKTISDLTPPVEETDNTINTLAEIIFIERRIYEENNV